MSEARILFNEDAFNKRSVVPSFDEALYGDLVEEYAPGSELPDIIVSPHMLWEDDSVLQKIRGFIGGETKLPVGGFSNKTNKITLPASADVERTNKLLLHETKHLIDAHTGESNHSPKVMKRRFMGGLAIATVGMTIGLLKGDRKLVAASAAVGLAAAPAAYWTAPHEVAARKFAGSPEVTDKFGRIITYQKAPKQ